MAEFVVSYMTVVVWDKVRETTTISVFDEIHEAGVSALTEDFGGNIVFSLCDYHHQTNLQ